MKKLLLSLLCLGLCFGIVGCGSDEDTSKDDSNSKTVTEEKKELEIVESGYSQTKDNDFVNYGIKIKNPTSSNVEFPVYTVTLYDKDGKVISTDEQTLNFISAQDTIFYGFVIDSKGKKVDKVDFKVNSIDDKLTDEQFAKTSDFKISNTNESDSTFTGEVTNNSSADCSQIAITLILKNKGKIVYGDTTFVDEVKSKDKKAFEFSCGELPKYDSYEFCAQVW